MRRKIVLIASLLVAALLMASPPDDEQALSIYKTVCLNSENGCPCYAATEGERVTFRFYHAQSVKSKSQADVKSSGKRVKINFESGSCYYPASDLIFMSEDRQSAIPAAIRERSHTFLDIHSILTGNQGVRVKEIGELQHQPLGYFWPTYYHLAKEFYYPGKMVAIINRRGEKVGEASAEFLKQVRWEGSGVTRDNRNLRWAGVDGRYEFYDNDIWGLGAGYGYTVYPYRTIAVNFPGFCRRLGKLVPGCDKKSAIGTLLYIKEVAERKINIGGTIHDGYFCAVDTGSPYYIREDRIDIFVGLHGGGNPYLPDDRQSNWLIAGGIENIVPSDWRIWTGIKERVWCDATKIPRNPFRPAPSDCRHDYHAVAAHKSLQLSVVLDEDGSPLRCRKRLPIVK